MIMKIFDTIIAFIKDPVGVGKRVFESIAGGIKAAFFGILRKAVSFVPDRFLPDFLLDPGEKIGKQISSFEKSTEKSLKKAGKTSAAADKAQTEIERIQNMIATGNYDKSIIGRGINSEEEALKRIAKEQAKIDKFQKNVSSSRYSAMAVFELEKQQAQILKQQQDDISDLKNSASGSVNVTQVYHNNLFYHF